MPRDPRLTTGSLAAVRPELIPLWDTAKNGDLTPHDVLNTSGIVKIHWKCPAGPDHEFIKAPNVMHGCPACHGRQASVTNSLASLNPDAVPYWDHAKNGDLTPDLVVNGSGKPAHWKCPAAPDHEWTKSPSAFAGCPYCAGKRPSSTNNLALTRPDIVAYWDHDANGDLTPEDLLPRSGTTVHWRCDAGPDHSWTRPPKFVFGCPYCTGNAVSTTNNLATRNPDIAAEWHPTKNSPLTPADVRYATNTAVWWQCPDGHAYQMPVCDRTGEQRRRCTECVRLHGRKFRIKKPLAQHRPEIAAYWDHDANGDLTPMDVSTADSRVVHWRCPEGPDHTWTRSVTEQRTPRCPYCTNVWVSVTNSLATIEPEVAMRWHPTRNGTLTPNDVLPGSGRTVWWQCPRGHDYEGTPNRHTNPSTRRSGCGQCAYEDGRPVSGRARSIADLYPHVVPFWHPTKNGTLTPNDTRVAHDGEVWLRCPTSSLHEWQATVKFLSRSKNPTCPFCFGWRVCADNNLAALHPELASQWHPTKNPELGPDQVTLIDAPAVWWKCDVADDHEWRSKVYSRAVMGQGCPACAGRQLSTTNRLDLLHPDVAVEFNSERNGTTPDKVQYGAPARVWWTCRHCQHEWQTRVEKRTKQGQGCPECAVYNVSKEELFLAHEVSAFLPVDFAAARVRDAAGKAWRIDIVVPESRLIIEYDGSYWHADRFDKDAEKTAALAAADWTVLRVREQPLPDLHDVWQVHCRPERYIETAATVVTALAERGFVDQSAASAYVASRQMVNRAAALLAIEARAVKRSARRQRLGQHPAA